MKLSAGDTSYVIRAKQVCLMARGDNGIETRLTRHLPRVSPALPCPYHDVSISRESSRQDLRPRNKDCIDNRPRDGSAYLAAPRGLSRGNDEILEYTLRVDRIAGR